MLQGLVAEGAESQVIGPVAGDLGRRPHPEGLALGQDVVRIGQHVAQLLVGALVVGGTLCDFVMRSHQLAIEQLVFVILLSLLVGEADGIDRRVEL